jgi:hypothetical protein
MADATKPKKRVGIRRLCPIHQEEMRGPDAIAREIYWYWRPACESVGALRLDILNSLAGADEFASATTRPGSRFGFTSKITVDES